MRPDEIPYIATRNFRLLTPEGDVQHIERGDIITFDGNEGVDVDRMLMVGAIIVDQKRLEALRNGESTCERV